MITGDLEYLISSLPYLTFQDTGEERSKVFSILKKYAAPSEAEKGIGVIFDDEARKFFNPPAYRIFEQIDLNTIYSDAFQKSKNKVLGAFSTYMYSLKRDIEQLRIPEKMGWNPQQKNPRCPWCQAIRWKRKYNSLNGNGTSWRNFPLGIMPILVPWSFIN